MVPAALQCFCRGGNGGGGGRYVGRQWWKVTECISSNIECDFRCFTR